MIVKATNHNYKNERYKARKKTSSKLVSIQNIVENANEINSLQAKRYKSSLRREQQRNQRKAKRLERKKVI